MDRKGAHAAFSANPKPLTTRSAEFISLHIAGPLYDDLLFRQSNIEAKLTPYEQRVNVDAHKKLTAVVAKRPNVSDPLINARISRGSNGEDIGANLHVTRLGVTAKERTFGRTNSSIHRTLLAANKERQYVQRLENKIEKQKKEELRKSQLQLCETANKSDHDDVDDIIIPRNPNEPPELTAMRPSREQVRRARSVSRKVRNEGADKNASECCFCPDPQHFDGKELVSELIGPFVDRRGNARLFVHFDCACWAPQVFAEPGTGQLRRVYDEYRRGRKLKCSYCGGKGGTIGCYVQKCKNVFHYRCLAKSGAKKVERFFVAFCRTHAHLGDKKAYQILMEAATIADVAAANRRQESTVGLDAPHSRFTLLRRRETEVIFSRTMKVCSHSGVFESSRIIFSHKTKRPLGKSDRLSLSDHARSLHISAFDVASGRLAYMALAGKGPIQNMTAVEARAALVSRDCSALFLLRNLKKSPVWKQGQITITKKTPDAISKPGVAPSESFDNSATPEKKNDLEYKPGDRFLSSGKRRYPENSKTAEEDGQEGSLPDRLTKRPRLSADGDNGGTKELKCTKRKFDPMSIEAITLNTEPVYDVQQVTEQPKEMDSSLKAPVVMITRHQGQTPPLQQKCTDGNAECRTALRDPKDSDGEKGCVTFIGKVKSAWETFLDEQLPKERLLRPDQGEADAMRNMARLWSLLSAEAREEYSTRARNLAYQPVQQTSSAVGFDSKTKGNNLNSEIAGLADSAGPNCTVVINDLPAEVGKGKQQGKSKHAMSLPVITRSDDRRYKHEISLRAVDWDSFLPAGVDEVNQEAGGEPSRGVGKSSSKRLK